MSLLLALQGAAAPSGSAAGNAGLSGSAVGARNIVTTAAGSAGVAGSDAGKKGALGTVAGRIGMAGSAVASKGALGMVAGSVGASGSTTARHQGAGSAVGVVGAAGAASGSAAAPVFGSASGAVGASGDAAGVAGPARAAPISGGRRFKHALRANPRHALAVEIVTEEILARAITWSGPALPERIHDQSVLAFSAGYVLADVTWPLGAAVHGVDETGYSRGARWDQETTPVHSPRRPWARGAAWRCEAIAQQIDVTRFAFSRWFERDFDEQELGALAALLEET